MRPSPISRDESPCKYIFLCHYIIELLNTLLVCDKHMLPYELSINIMLLPGKYLPSPHQMKNQYIPLGGLHNSVDTFDWEGFGCLPIKRAEVFGYKEVVLKNSGSLKVIA